jgi:hypothetical protein
MEHSGDYVHQCNSGNLTLDQEDKVVISPIVDEFGNSNTSTGRMQGDILYQGTVDKLRGTKSEIEGNDVESVTRRGVRASTHRQRQRYEYIK